MFWSMLWLLVTAVAVGFGYSTARRFVRQRLRYVDAAQGGGAPWIAAAVATLLGLLIAAVPFVPMITAATAVFFGASVGLGVSAGARDVRNGSNLLGPG
jgi:hypothetical protein